MIPTSFEKTLFLRLLKNSSTFINKSVSAPVGLTYTYSKRPFFSKVNSVSPNAL